MRRNPGPLRRNLVCPPQAVSRAHTRILDQTLVPSVPILLKKTKWLKIYIGLQTKEPKEFARYVRAVHT